MNKLFKVTRRNFVTDYILCLQQFKDENNIYQFQWNELDYALLIQNNVEEYFDKVFLDSRLAESLIVNSKVSFINLKLEQQ